MTSAAAASERALILAPWGRDAQVASGILREAGIEPRVCADMFCLLRDLEGGAGVAILVEEVLHAQDYAPLVRWLEAQPAWSDLPVIILAQRGAGLERNPAAGRFVQALGNITFLERPFHPTTLVSVVNTALRGRRRQYEAREQLDAFQAAEERFRTLAENIPILCWMAQPDGYISWFNLRWYQYTGTTPQDQEGWGWTSVHHADVLPSVTERWRHSLSTGEPFEMTFPILGADGVFRPFLTRVVPLRDQAGRIVRWFGTHTDVSEQQENQARLRLMINELNHRVKNTLATVQSIAAQTLRGQNIPSNLKDNLTSRILALSQAHNVLTDAQWSGAELREIVLQMATPYQSVQGPARIRIDGPSVSLPPKTAIAIALALHELATNAAKYGALSNATGHVDVRWALEDGAEDRRLSLIWREAGGPPVRPPSRTGFGTRLIERGLATDLHGSVVLSYPREGVVCEIEARLPVGVDGQFLFSGDDAWSSGEHATLERFWRRGELEGAEAEGQAPAAH